MYAWDERLRHTHSSITEQGRAIDDMQDDIRQGGATTMNDLDECKTVMGCKGTSIPVAILKYTNATLLFDYPICHLLCLGLYPQILRHFIFQLGPRFLVLIRRSDFRSSIIRRPSEMKRPIRALLPQSSDNVCSGFKIEDTIHHMENIGPLTFFTCFTGTQKLFLSRGREDRPDANGPSVGLIDQHFHLLWRFISVAMFLLRGADGLRVTEEQAADDPELVRKANIRIERRRDNFDADVNVLCKLMATIIGAKGLTPNLHDLFCVIGWLLRRKGHPKFELGIERLVSTCLHTSACLGFVPSAFLQHTQYIS